jgi:DNA repair exonuclease SbcCD ATPase subunit
MFAQMIELINDRLADYAQFLNFQPVFHIDLETGLKNFEIIVFQYEHQRPYVDLSGGEKQLVDVCLAFAIHDVVMMEQNTNLLVMDEVFESLDSENIELVTRLLEMKAQDLSLHLITHRKEFSIGSTNHTQLELQRGIGTVIVS